MRIAFLADIHANLEALRACLADARGRSVDRYVYLGDIVGYGADPAACVDVVAQACEQGALALDALLHQIIPAGLRALRRLRARRAHTGMGM